MSYQPLYKLYYKDQSQWAAAYEQRFTNEFTTKLDFTIKEYNHRQEHQLFYCNTPEISLLLEKIATNCLKLSHCCHILPPLALTQYLYSCLIVEVKNNNSIEGVYSSRQSIGSVLTAATNLASSNTRLQGIVNKYRLLTGPAADSSYLTGLTTPASLRQLYDEFILDEIKQDNPHNLPDGALFRKNSVDIVTSTQKIIHRGAYPEEAIIQQLTKALALLQQKSLPLLIRIIIFHYLFAYIHPFYDGNGRMARFISAALLAQEIHPAVGLRLSLLIKKQRQLYYQLFQQTNSNLNKGDLTPFITNGLQLIRDAITGTTVKLTKNAAKYQRLSQSLEALPNFAHKELQELYPLLLQASIFSSNGITLEDLAKALGKSSRTVQRRLSLVPPEALLKGSLGRSHTYRLSLDYLLKTTKRKSSQKGP